MNDAIYNAVVEKLDWFQFNMSKSDYSEAQNDNQLVDNILSGKNDILDYDGECMLYERLIDNYKDKNPNIDSFIEAVNVWEDEVDNLRDLNDTYNALRWPI